MKILRICFVCHGNICRSPFAEALARRDTHKKGWSKKIYLDSAGTSTEHLGERSHALSRKLGEHMGLTMNHLARQFTADEFDDWDYVIALDKHNFKNLKKLTTDPHHLSRLTLLRDWDEYATSHSVPDPWGRGEDAYEEMAEIISNALVEFYVHLAQTHTQLKT